MRLEREPQATHLEPEKASWRRAVQLLQEQRKYTVILIIVSGAAGVCESSILALVATVASTIVRNNKAVSFNLGPLHATESALGLLMIAFAFAGVRLLLQGALSYVPSRMASENQARMRRELFHSYLGAPWRIQSVDGEGRFQEIATNQIVQATGAILNAVGTLTSLVMLSVLVAAALVVEPLTAVIVMAVASTLFSALRPLTKVARRQARALSRSQVAYAEGVHTAVSVAEEVRVFGVADRQEGQVELLVEGARRTSFRTQLTGRLVPGIYQCIIFLLLIGGLTLLVVTHNTHVASLGAVVLLLVRASSYSQSVQSGWVSLLQSLPFIDRVKDAQAGYEAEPVVRGAKGPHGVPSLRFDNVSYAYAADRPVLRDVSFEIVPGDSVGLVGPTGAGKSTLVQILLGLRAPDTGTYFVDEEAAENCSPDLWTDCFAYIGQEPRLLRGTVSENIAFYRDLDEDDVVTAAKQAYIHKEISEWPLGYRTQISQRVLAVSGGQRQRICLARALAGDPKVLVLDEPTSQLDPRSESLVQESLVALRGKLTLFIVAHRLSTLNLCDRVMVMRDGQIEAFAPASELEISNEFFRNAATLSRRGGLAAAGHPSSSEP